MSSLVKCGVCLETLNPQPDDSVSLRIPTLSVIYYASSCTLNCPNDGHYIVLDNFSIAVYLRTLFKANGIYMHRTIDRVNSSAQKLYKPCKKYTEWMCLLRHDCMYEQGGY